MEIQREAVQMGGTSENKKERILSSLHRLGHPGTELGVQFKHVPFLENLCLCSSVSIILFSFFPLSFFLIQQIPEGEKKEIFTSEPGHQQRNTNYADEKFTTFHRPSPFSHRPPDLNQTNHCPTRNKRVLHYFHGPYFPQHVEGPLSSPFLPPSLLFFFLSFLSLFPHPRGFFRVVHRAAPGYPLCAGFPFHGSRFFLRRVSSKIPIECLPREKSILSDN